jgi:phage terminase large subunit GpA-like protein
VGTKRNSAATPELPEVGTWGGGFLRGLEPRPSLTVSQWADEHRILSKRSSNEAGPWRTSRTPYLREIMDSLSPDCPAKEVVFKKGAQIGGTECGNNWIGYLIDYDPAPTMIVVPTLDLAKRWGRQRLDPMIADCPAIARKIGPHRSREQSRSAFMKEFPDGVLVLAGANSSASLRSMPVRYVMLDELDEYPQDVDGQGDPAELALRGPRTFPNRKILKVSTPTTQALSRITRDYNRSDRRSYLVPCPLCGERQKLVWPQIRFRSDEIDEGSRIVHEAWYECARCKGRIEESSKAELLEAGAWVPERPELSDRIRGYHLSALYSPPGWRTWTEIVETFLRVKALPRQLMVWTNHDLGEEWRDETEAPDWEKLYERREGYRIGTVPAGVSVLTCGVDVQGDRLELEVVGWGENLESWSIDYRTIPGDPTLDHVWHELEGILQVDWPRERGGSLRIRGMAVDEGFETMSVRRWVRTQRADMVFAVKGATSFQTLVMQPTAVEVKERSGRRLKRGLKLWKIGTELAKSELYSWLRRARPAPEQLEARGWPPGWCHFPMFGEEYFRQLCAEQLVATTVRGYRRYLWEKTRERNEALDCRTYARAAAAILGVDRWGPERWREEAGIVAEDQDTGPRRPRKRSRSGGFLDRHR